MAEAGSTKPGRALGVRPGFADRSNATRKTNPIQTNPDPHRRCTMKTSKMQLLAGALVLAALLAVSGVSQAACGSSKRVSHNDAVCLDAGWETDKDCFWGVCHYSSDFWATSRCNGKVVVKVDLRAHTDKTWHLNYAGHGKNSSADLQVNGIYCCKDISASNNCRTN